MQISPFSDIDEAKYRLVHDYRGGSKALAPLVGMNPGTLSNKVNPNVDTHHLTVDESIVLQNATGDTQLIEAEARVLGGIFIKLGDYRNITDTELLDKYAEWIQDIGETSAALRQCFSDRKITKKHLTEIHREMHEDFSRAMELYHRLEAISDE